MNLMFRTKFQMSDLLLTVDGFEHNVQGGMNFLKEKKTTNFYAELALILFIKNMDITKKRFFEINYFFEL